MAKKTLRYAVKHVYPHIPVTLFNTKYEALRFINDNGHNHIATVGVLISFDAADYFSAHIKDVLRIAV